MLHKDTVLVKKRHFYVKKLLFYKLNGCKNTTFLQKYIFVKKLHFYKLTGRKNTAFLQKYIFVYFYRKHFCTKTAFYVKKGDFCKSCFICNIVLIYTHINRQLLGFYWTTLMCFSMILKSSSRSYFTTACRLVVEVLFFTIIIVTMCEPKTVLFCILFSQGYQLQ